MRLDNRIGISITFRERVGFSDAIFRISRMLEFLGLLVGRPQNLRELSLDVGTRPEEPIILKVHWSNQPRRERANESREPDAFDILLDAAGNPEEFSQVLPKWLERQPEWNDARFRFFNSFAKQRFYDIDRLTGAANMFDVLPNSAVPPDIELEADLREAKASAKAIFRRLAPGPERNSVLDALGRMEKSSLKRKIRHRSERVTKALGGYFQDLDLVTDEAVNCRNYYVHGSAPRFEYNRHFNAVIFFVDTLEFVFAASDLIEAGWNAKAWSGHGTVMSHPFGRYKATYAGQLQMLKALLS